MYLSSQKLRQLGTITFILALVIGTYAFFTQPIEDTSTEQSSTAVSQEAEDIKIDREVSEEIDTVGKKASENVSTEGDSVTTHVDKVQPDAKTNPEASFNIVIAEDMTIDNISAILSQEEVILDADEFKNFMQTHDFTDKILPGTYHIHGRMSFEEIATKMIGSGDSVNPDASFNIVITEDMTLENIAAILRVEGVILNPEEFNDFMQSRDYADQIRPGTYHIHGRMTFEDIATKITGIE